MYALGTETIQQRLPGPYDSYIYTAAKLANIEPEIIAAHIMQESSYNPNAVHKDLDGVSSYGLMQVRLDTARNMLNEPKLTPEQLSHPKINILAGAKYIQQSRIKWPNIKDSIAAYNAGKPRKNSAGQYVNSKGVTNVQYYVDRVYGFYQKYQAGAAFKPVSFQTSSYILPGLIGILGVGLLLWKRPA